MTPQPITRSTSARSVFSAWTRFHDISEKFEMMPMVEDYVRPRRARGRTTAGTPLHRCGLDVGPGLLPGWRSARPMPLDDEIDALGRRA